MTYCNTVENMVLTNSGIKETQSNTEIKHEFYERCLNDLGFFFEKVVWRTLNGDTLIKAPYAHDLLIEYAEAFEAKQVRKLLISIPPRNMKTTLFTIALPLWQRLRDPMQDWLTTSASETIITDFHSERSRVSESPLYQAIAEYKWGAKFNKYRQNSMIVVENGYGGKIYQWPFLLTRIGVGYNYGVIDDPIAVKDGRNIKYCAKVAKEFMQGTLSRRHTKQLGIESPTAVIQQRVGETDLVGEMKERGWEYVELQAIAEENQRYVFPMSGRVWDRPACSVMNPERESFETLQALRKDTLDFQCQYQQRPISYDGAMVDDSELQRYTAVKESYLKIVMTVDCAATTAAYSSNWGFIIAGIKEGREADILYCHAKKYEYPGGKKMCYDLVEEWCVDELVIENKNTGLALIPEVKQMIIDKGLTCGVISYDPGSSKKEDRILDSLKDIKKAVYFPDLDRLPHCVWVSLVFYELLSFPNCATFDLLDCLVLLVERYLKRSKKVNLNKFYGIG